MAVLLGCAVSQSRAADEVLSGNIREADNRTGQSTNRGAGIKTNHLANGAVNSAKIKDGGVATVDLANGAVTSAKIQDGGVTGTDLAPGAVGPAAIADGSVGETELAPGAVSAAKIAAGAVTPGKIGFYSRVVVVDVNGGGDFTSPVDAVNAIGDASETNRYLVKLMPGVYDVGSASVVMKPRVDIEGSGEGMTLITGQVSTDSSIGAGLVVGASGAEIRSLTLENTAAGLVAVGFYTPEGAAPSLLQVTVRAVGPAQNKFGIFSESDSKPAISRVTVLASGGESATGIQSNSLAATLSDVSATASGATRSNVGIINYLNGAITMKHVEATASGASSGGSSVGNVGIWNQLVSPTMNDVTATASGSTHSNIGVLNELAGIYSLTNVVATGRGTLGYGMRARANSGSPGSIAVTADRCTFAGDTASVLGDAEFTVRIGASKLAGGAAGAGGGVLTCVASYAGNYGALEGDCLGCRPSLGTFELSPSPFFADVNACVNALQAAAATKCCSGVLNPQGGFVFGTNPQVCQGICQ